MLYTSPEWPRKQRHSRQGGVSSGGKGLAAGGKGLAAGGSSEMEAEFGRHRTAESRIDTQREFVVVAPNPIRRE